MEQANLEIKEPRCKRHPERVAVVNKYGQSTGMCKACLSAAGRKGGRGKAKKVRENEDQKIKKLAAELVRRPRLDDLTAVEVLGIQRWQGMLLRLSDRYGRVLHLIKGGQPIPEGKQELQGLLMDIAEYALLAIDTLGRQK